MSAPNPGTREALDAGCTCPILDNNHGKWPPFPPSPIYGEKGAWYIHEDCPVHDISERPDDV